MKFTYSLLYIGIFFLSFNAFADTDKSIDQKFAEFRNYAVASYNNKDIEAVMSTWRADGAIVGYAAPQADILVGSRRIRASYLENFNNSDFSKISMKSEITRFVNDVVIDSGTLTFLNADGSKGLTGCYVMIYVQTENSFKAIKEFSYPNCMGTNPEESLAKLSY